MNRPSAASTATPAAENAHDTTAAATARAGPGRQFSTAAATTTAAATPAIAKLQAGAQASGQATVSRPRAMARTLSDQTR
jgi:hypothetical protein